MGRLEVWVRAIGAEQDPDRRNGLAREAWDQTQRLVAWLRLLRTELDFLTVEGGLAGDAQQHQAGAEDGVPMRSLTVWPVGMELERSGKLVIFCLDTDSGRPVVLRDHLSEFDADAPMSRPVISRLLQDSVELGALLGSLIRLEDHPVVERRHSLLFRPAFRAIPRPLAVTDSFAPPLLPELDPLRKGVLTPVRAPASVVIGRDGRARLRAAMPVQGSAVLQLNATKALVREAADRLEVELVVRPRGESLRVLCATTDEDGRVFVADDPTLFRLAPSSLARVAMETAAHLPDDTVAGCWLRATAFLFGGAADEAVDRLREDLARAGREAVGLDEHYRLGLCRFVLGEDLPGDDVRQVVADALTLATLPHEAAVPLEPLERVLGRPVSHTDLRHVDDPVIYWALWLAHQAGLCEELGDALHLLVSRRYQDQVDSSAPEAVCARTLATHLVEEADDDEDEQGGAAEFFEAHLDDIMPGRRRGRRRPPLPELLELFQFGDTQDLLEGEDRHGHTVAELEPPWMEVAQACADPLLRWRAEPPEAEDAMAAGDALLLVAAANLRRCFVY